jgi:predicted enzyme related to lactoylglutathione lyase
MSSMVGWPFWMGVVTEDLERQRRFHAEVLGLREIDAGEDWVQFELDGNMIEVLARTDAPEYDRPRVQVGFAVIDIHAARKELIARGAEPITEVLGSADSSYWAYFRDPDGNVFEITERLKRP